MARAEDAEAAELRQTAAENVSVDWVKGKGTTQTPRKASQWEAKMPPRPLPSKSRSILPPCALKLVGVGAGRGTRQWAFGQCEQVEDGQQ